MSDVPAVWWSPTEGVLAADQAQSYVWKDDLPSDAVRLAPAATPAALSDRFREATADVERVRDGMTTHPGAYGQVIDALTLLTRWLASDPEDPAAQAATRALTGKAS